MDARDNCVAERSGGQAERDTAWRCRIAWGLLLLLAAALRLPAADWDAGIAAHPDERFLLGVAQQVPLYGNVCSASPGFPYGHLPVTLARLLVLTAPNADPLYAARLLSALIGVALVALTGSCGRALAGRRAGLLAGCVAAFAPFLIQQARFYTVDPLAAALAAGAVLAATRRRGWAAGGLMGLAVASKASVVIGVLPLLAPVLFRSLHGRGWSRQRMAHAFGAAVPFTAFMVLTFAAVSPWSLLTPVACWQGPLTQSLMASGRFEFPYTQQYAGTLPYVYPLVQMGLWGLGPVATLLGLAGLLAAGGKVLRRRTWSQARAVPVLWTLIFFLTVGALHVKFPRYLLPLYPWWIAWAVYGTWAGWGLVARLGKWSPAVRGLRWVAGGLLVVGTVPLGLAQAGLYATPHPWTSASEMLTRRLPDGAAITVEAWDHPLPVPLPDEEIPALHPITLPIFDEEGDEKARALRAGASEAEAMVIASRRGYGALSRQPERYAATLAWYQTLLDSHDAAVFTRCPRIGPLAITDDPLRDAGMPVPVDLAARCGTRYALRLPKLDESFRVYDAPLTLILMKETPY